MTFNDFPWIFRGLSVDFLWIFYGHSVDFPWLFKIALLKFSTDSDALLSFLLCPVLGPRGSVDAYIGTIAPSPLPQLTILFSLYTITTLVPSLISTSVQSSSRQYRKYLYQRYAVQSISGNA